MHLGTTWRCKLRVAKNGHIHFGRENSLACCQSGIAGGIASVYWSAVKTARSVPAGGWLLASKVGI